MEVSEINLFVQNYLNINPFGLRILFGIGSLIFLNIIFVKRYLEKKRINCEEKIKVALMTIKANCQEKITDPKESLDLKRQIIVGEKRTNPLNEEWLNSLDKTADELIEDGKFSIMELSQAMFLSERQLRRRMKDNAQMLPADYLKEKRLLKAKELLENNVFETVTEVAYQVGFSTPKHFSKVFKERFGESPSKILKNNLHY